MTSLALVRLVCAVIVVLATLVGVAVFARACVTIANRMRVGRPAPERVRPVWRRAWLSLSAAVSHRAFKNRPWIRAAHWLVMVSFPLLFLTLVTGYGQVLAGPRFDLPWLGHQVWWTWIVEILAWTSLAGILSLAALRHRLTRRGAAAPPFPDAESGPTRPRTPRFSGSTAWQARFVEGVVASVVACVLVLRMLEHAQLAVAPDPAHRALASWTHFPLTAWSGPLLEPVGANALAIAITVVATIKVVISMSWFVVVGLQPSMGVSWHRFLAFVTVYTRRELDGSKALGPLQPLVFTGSDGVATPLTAESMDELDAAMEAAEESGSELRLGVGRIEDFTWKGLLDFSTCTECGRCQDLCPAWNTGKPLSPKLLVMALRDHHAAAAPYLRAARAMGVGSEEVTADDVASRPAASPLGRVLGMRDGLARDVSLGLAPGSAHTGDVLGSLLAAKASPTDTGVAARPAPLAGEVVPAEVLWSCTTCGACVDQCPVDIELVDRVIDIRREQVLMASAFPKELGQMFRKLESKGNPWGLAPRKRMEWTKGLDFEVPVVGVDVESAEEVDYLLWVGCAGAYEDRAKRTTRAVAELLDIAGVSFAVLGDAETCTGDPARRAGNEILFQMLAAQNVETLNEAGARRIVVTCAHCFNTLAREYPQVGGHYEVLHHTQLLNTLVREGRLRPVAPQAAAARSPRSAAGAEAAATTGPTGATEQAVPAGAGAAGGGPGSPEPAGAGAAGGGPEPVTTASSATGSGSPESAGAGAAGGGPGSPEPAGAGTAGGGPGSPESAGAGAAGGGPGSPEPAGAGTAGGTPPAAPTVTYHDACYLGRHNQVYTAPRELLDATGATAVEMPRSRERALCCGGGGARVFMEESIGTRIAVERAREALGTGAQIVATACPFCTTMLSDGVASQGDQVRVTDVATLMLEAVKRGQ